MSLLYLEHRDELCFGIWHITESERELETLSGCTAPTRLTNSSRRLEYLAIRALAVAMNLDPGSIDYLSSGKPYLKDDTRAISFSHTKNHAAMVVGRNPLIGIDIEQRTQRVERVRHKFMHPLEDAMLEESNLDTTTGLLVHWCAKEAVFKAVPEVEIDFANEIRVTHLPFMQSLAKSDARPTGEVVFLRTHTTFQLEAWIMPAFVMDICHSGVTDHPVLK